MALIRALEEAILELLSQGKVFGTTHACIGQEADSVGILSHAMPEDMVFSTHRGHGHYLALTGDVDGLVAELMGRTTGICGGRGGSQHVSQPNFLSNGVLGGTIPSATGVALAKKLLKEPGCVIAFMGDGTLGEGVIYEAFNMASLWRLPILYVLEDNGYGQTTPKALAVAGDIELRGKAFGLATSTLETTDVEVIYKHAGPLVEAAHSGEPTMWVISTYRLCPHSKGDDTRPPAEVEEHRQYDPLRLQGRRLFSGVATSIDEWCRQQVAQAIEKAQDAPYPTLGQEAGTSPRGDP